MNTRIKTLTILTALLAGTLVTEAQRGDGQGRGQNGRHKRGECPECGQRLNAQRPKPEEGQRGPRRNAQANQGRRGQGQRSPAYQGQRDGQRQRFQAPEGQRERGAYQAQSGQRQNAQAYQGRPDQVQRPRLNPEQRRAILEKFDKNGDGRLSEKERAKARKAWKKRQQANRDGEGVRE